jgi:plastocyanin
VGHKVATRVVAPFALPVSAVLVGVVMVASVSRILLDITPHAAVAVSLLVAALVFAGCAIAATGARLSPRLLGVMTGVALLALVSAATVAGVRGTRAEENRAPRIPQVHLTAQGTAYQQKQITVPDSRFQLSFTNDDLDVYHDVALYSAPSGGTPYIAFTPFAGIGHQKYPAVDLGKLGMKPGKYYFRCDFHPAMVGTFTVTAPAGGGSPG